jgi:hypothetical protein
MTAEDCARLVFGEPTCGSSTQAVASISSSMLVEEEVQNTNVDMTVKASGTDGAPSSKAILTNIDADMSDPTSDLMSGAIMKTADTSESLLSKSSTITNYKCWDGTLTTVASNCPIEPTHEPTSGPTPRGHTTTTLSVNLLTPVYGQIVTLTATIGISSGTGNPMGGKVIFKNNGKQIGSLISVNNLKKAITLYKITILGENKITASYIADANFLGSTSAAKIVNAGQAWTKMTVKSSKNPSIKGQSITLTFTVTPTLAFIPTIPTGNVKVFDGGNLLKTVTLSNGTGSFSVSNFTKGTHTITAQYQGNKFFKKSTLKTNFLQRVN